MAHPYFLSFYMPFPIDNFVPYQKDIVCPLSGSVGGTFLRKQQTTRYNDND